MIKTNFRQEVLKALKAMESDSKLQKDRVLLADVVNSFAYQKAKTIGTYLSLPTEYQTDLMIKQALADGKRVVIPKTFPKGRMIFVPYDPNDLVISSFGILEPRSQQEVPKSAIDLLHVPGVVFNNEGFRIGYGGGYYDRYLENYEGVSFSTIYNCQLKEFVPEAHDIAVQEVYLK
ncbi:5-formyltetrahydrofolate cyclo-ligase [Streptococcus castoreus]|uniref:5-formyltetrahydrofolate cyclo-ligase n=1 Tax=Streptococcus castoreus TaxID=254786 RepID=UPI00048750ED|nr:5-formyltetrahydrofolate cyclo-ligase [Streptococcus castoreus]